MYSPKIVQASVRVLEDAYKRELKEYSIDECAEFKDRLSDAFNEKGQQIRPYLPDEQSFVENELLMTKASYEYWAKRYCIINKDASTIAPMYPLLPSQQFILTRIGELEEKIHSGEREDGILINLLKGGRQIGGSTLAESINAHRTTTQGNLFGLIAADVPQQSAYLFDMYARMVEGLPAWIRPEILEKVKDTEIKFEGGTNIWVGSGKSVRGTTGQRGQLGRGKTLSIGHLSELSTWDATDQIQGALLPTIPRSPRVFFMFESTAKGRGGWWHEHWQKSRKGIGRFVPIFIPWYAEPKKFSLTPPEGWIPKDTTIAHMKRCEATGGKWTGGQVKLTKDQLFWYEITRNDYEESGQLSTFLEEYGAADDDECFQFSGKTIFGAPLIQRIQDVARPVAGALEIKPMRDIR
jgi:hypothetical protein